MIFFLFIVCYSLARENILLHQVVLDLNRFFLAKVSCLFVHVCFFLPPVQWLLIKKLVFKKLKLTSVLFFISFGDTKVWNELCTECWSRTASGLCEVMCRWQLKAGARDWRNCRYWCVFKWLRAVVQSLLDQVAPAADRWRMSGLHHPQVCSDKDLYIRVGEWIRK